LVTKGKSIIKVHNFCVPITIQEGDGDEEKKEEMELNQQ
jgi:hypothetical protein